MNRKIWLIILIPATVIMAYLVFKIIKDEVDYQKRVEEVDNMVIERLEELRKMQLAYRDTKGHFADSFHKLFDFMRNGKYPKLRQVGERDGSDSIEIKTDSIFVNPMMEVFGTKDYAIEELRKVPPHDTAEFIMSAGFILKNNVTVPVFEIRDPHPFNKERGKALQVGDRYDAITTGNWR